MYAYARDRPSVLTDKSGRASERGRQIKRNRSEKLNFQERRRLQKFIAGGIKGTARSGPSPGVEQVNRPITIRTTGPNNRPPWWPESTGISFELQDAWSLPAPPDIQTELPLPQTQVLSWLRGHQGLIIAAEKRWRVDRRAIAAAIAWEALVNVRTASIRAVGPAKVHTNADVVREVEAAGYLPRQTASARRELLKTPAGAIMYVGAIMNAKAQIAEALGFPSIRNRVDILTNEFQGRSLQEWTDHLLEKKDTVFVGENTMSSWAAQHIRYIELGVGTSDNAAINGLGFVSPSGTRLCQDI